MNYREFGKNALREVLNNPKNITVLEKYVYIINNEMAEDDDEIESLYKQNIYQVVGDILSGGNLKLLLDNIKEGKLGWKHPSFQDVTFRMEEQDDFIINPFEVEEGVLECRCGSKRVFSYSKQVKSSDEATTTFAQCMACKVRWTSNL